MVHMEVGGDQVLGYKPRLPDCAGYAPDAPRGTMIPA
jgi:hypothetical protein